MKKIILVLLFSLLFVTAYSQVMQVTIQFLTVYHANGNDSPILRVSVDNRGYNFSGRNYGGFQTGGGISDVSNDPNNYDTYVITRSEFTPIRIDYEGWNDRCHTVNSTYWDFNDNCKCQAGPINVPCKGKDDYNRYSFFKDINFWESTNDGASSPMYYTGNNQQGFTIRVTWTPIQPASLVTNLLSPEACGNADIILTATLPAWFTSGLPATVSPYLKYVWQEGIPLGGNYTYTTIATTTSNIYTYKAPANAPLSGSLNRQFRVYTTLNNVYSQAGTLLNNPINIFPPPPTGITSIVNPNSCNGMSTPDGNVLITGVTGGVGIYFYTLTNGSVINMNSSKPGFPLRLPADASNSSVSGLPAGTYNLTISNYSGGSQRCAYTTILTMTEPAPLTVTSVQKSDYNGYNVSCKGSTNATATISGTGGNLPYTYLFDNENTFAVPVASNSSGVFTGYSAGTYYTKIKDAKNCPVTLSTVTITEPTILSTTPVKTDVQCNGAANGQINMNSTGGAGGYTYSMNNNPFVATLPFTGLAPGNYTVVTKDQNNCTVTSIPTSIAEPPALILSVSDKQDILCNGASTGSVLLSASGGVTTYQYSYDGINYQPSGTFNSIPAGTYNLKVKDRNNCITSTSAQFTEPAALQNTFVIENVTCFGREDGNIKANISGGVSPYRYNWLGRSETIDSISNLYAGNYILSMHDANNCVLQQTAIVNAPPSSLIIQSITSSNSTCEGICDGNVNVNVSGGIAPYTYYYNSIQSSSNILTSACGENYIIKVKDNYNCIITDQIRVPLTSTFGFDLPDSITLCTGQSYTVDVTAANTDVTMTSFNGFTSSAKSVQLSVTDKYYVSLSNAQGCFKKDTMVLTTSSDLLQSRFIVPTISYAGDTINFVDLSWPRPDSVSWILSVPTDTIGNDEGFIRLSYKDVGTYTIKLTAYMGACRDSVTKTVTFEVPPSLRTVDDSLGLGFHSINTIKLYPVPNSGKFIVEISSSHNGEITADIINMFGEVIDTQIHTGSLVYKTNYDFLSISSGMYILRVKSKDDAKVIKFIVE